MNSSKSATGNQFAAYIALGKILAMAAQFVMPLFLTRFLSKADYGLYSQFYLILGFVSAIFAFGIQSNLYYFYPGKNESEQRTIVQNTFLLLLFFGLLGVLLLFIPFIKTGLIGDGPLLDYFYIILINIYLCIPATIILPLATVRKDKWITIIYPPADVLLKVALIIPIALYFKTLYAIFVAILLLHSVQFVFILIYLLAKYGGIHIAKDSIRLIKQQLAYSLPFGFAVIINTVCQRIDKVICVSFLTPEDYATYSVAFFGIPGIMQIYDSLCQVNVMNMATAFHNNQKSKIIDLYKGFVTKTLSFSIPLIIIAIIFAPQIISILFTDKYVDSVPFFRLYVATFFIAMFGAGTILRAIGRTTISMRAFLYAAIICVPLSYFLIQQFHIWGAMISALVNTILPKILQMFFEARELNVNILNLIPVGKIGTLLRCTIFPLIPIAILCYYYDISNGFAVGLAALYLLAAYALELKHQVFIVPSQKVKTWLKRFYKF